MTPQRRRRTTAALGALLGAAALVAPTSAQASCRPWVVDPSGDARPHDAPLNEAPSESSLDVEAVDLTAQGSTLVLTMRLAQINALPTPTRLFDVQLPTKDRLYDAYWYFGADKSQFSFQDEVYGGTVVDGTYDSRTATVRWTIPRYLIDKKVTRFDGADVFTSVLAGTNDLAYGEDFDEAHTTRPYLLGTRGCL